MHLIRTLSLLCISLLQVPSALGQVREEFNPILRLTHENGTNSSYQPGDFTRHLKEKGYVLECNVWSFLDSENANSNEPGQADVKFELGTLDLVDQSTSHPWCKRGFQSCLQSKILVLETQKYKLTAKVEELSRGSIGEPGDDIWWVLNVGVESLEANAAIGKRLIIEEQEELFLQENNSSVEFFKSLVSLKESMKLPVFQAMSNIQTPSIGEFDGTAECQITKEPKIETETH